MTQHGLTAYQRVMLRVERAENGCLEFSGKRTRDGYGSIKVDGVWRRASRVVYEQHHGEIPAGLFVLHHCDNPPCVNIAHLWLGTIADNNRDMEDKGRSRHLRNATSFAHGTANINARLTDSEVAEIRRRRLAGETLSTIAEAFSVSTAHVSNIASGRRRAAA